MYLNLEELDVVLKTLLLHFFVFLPEPIKTESSLVEPRILKTSIILKLKKYIYILTGRT